MSANLLNTTSSCAQRQEIAICPNGAPSQTRLIQTAIDQIAGSGGGIVILLPGEYLSGTIFLKSGVTLHLEKGAVLRGSTNIEDYAQRISVNGARVGGGVAIALIYADCAEGIGLTGEGTIDGSGHEFFTKNENPPDWVEARKPLGTWIPAWEYRAHPRPRSLVLFSECHDVCIENLRIENSPAWTIHFLACTKVLVRGITLRGALHGCNTDGIDIDACSDVLIEDSDIFTGDDAVCLKNTNTWGLKRPSRHVMVRRCRLRSTTHGFSVGTETQDTFEDISLLDSRIESAGDYRTLTGIGLSILDGGAIRGVHIKNVVIADAIGPIQIRLGNVGRGQATKTPGVISGILLEDISIERSHGNCLIAGLANHSLKNIVLRNIDLEFAGAIDSSRILAELPELETEFPPGEVWRFLPAYGFYCRHIDGLELSCVNIKSNVPENRPALTLKNVTSLKCDTVSLADHCLRDDEQAAMVSPPVS